MFCAICTKHFFCNRKYPNMFCELWWKQPNQRYTWGGGGNIGPTSQIFNKLFNKNTIKLKVEDPLLGTNIVSSIDPIPPRGILVQTCPTLRDPNPGSLTVCIYIWTEYRFIFQMWNLFLVFYFWLNNFNFFVLTYHLSDGVDRIIPTLFSIWI